MQINRRDLFLGASAVAMGGQATPPSEGAGPVGHLRLAEAWYADFMDHCATMAWSVDKPFSFGTSDDVRPRERDAAIASKRCVFSWGSAQWEGWYQPEVRSTPFRIRRLT